MDRFIPGIDLWGKRPAPPRLCLNVAISVHRIERGQGQKPAISPWDEKNPGHQAGA